MKYKILSIEFDAKISPKEVTVTTTNGPFSLKEAKAMIASLEGSHQNCSSICIPIRATTIILKDLKKAISAVISDEIVAKKKRIAAKRRK